MKTIWKFPLGPLKERTEILVPLGARILTVQPQPNPIDPQATAWHRPLRLCLWAIVDPAAEAERRLVLIVGTGQPIPDPLERWEYITSVQHGAYVWHCFIDRDRELAEAR